MERTQLTYALPTQVHVALGLCKYDLLACKESCPNKRFGLALQKLDPFL